MLQVRETRFHYADGLVVLRICAPLEHWLQKMRFVDSNAFFHSCFFTDSIHQGWANLFNRKVICRKTKKQRAAKPVCSANTNMVKNASFTFIDVQ